MAHQKDDSHDWLGDVAENYVRYCFARDGFEVFGSGKWAADLIVRSTKFDDKKKWWRIEVKSGRRVPSLKTMAKKAELFARVKLEKGTISFSLKKLKPKSEQHKAGQEIKGKGDINQFLFPGAKRK